MRRERRAATVVTGTGDGGMLTDTASIRLQHEELDDYRFTGRGRAAMFLPPDTAPRIPAALSARSSGIPAYLPRMG